ncbi:MAG: hypothetical protein V7K18_22405 [Nostoc sp.]|uniref:hypothetical protein n=1 Tax=Nostoc sp. TaxID=1180 RepID=UPI002FF64262
MHYQYSSAIALANRIRGYTDKTHLRGLKIFHLKLLQAMPTAVNYATFLTFAKVVRYAKA